VLFTKGSPLGGHSFPLCSAVPVNQFTLRDLYVPANISGNSLNIDEAIFSSSVIENSESLSSSTTSISNASFEYVRAPEPPGGVQEWWARILSGSLNISHSASGCLALGESQ
jgi:hypothetical protein